MNYFKVFNESYKYPCLKVKVITAFYSEVFEVLHVVNLRKNTGAVFRYSLQFIPKMSKFATFEDVKWTHDCLVLSDATNKVGDCLQYGKNPKKYTWYRKTLPDGSKVGEYAHKITLMVSLRSCIIPPGVEASHLCGMQACINPAHLTAEPHGKNMNRVQCHDERKCFGCDPACIL